MVLATYGRSSGFAMDPIEKKPLSHFYPGTGVLSFGTAGCNLMCKFCQNWDISKARSFDRLQSDAGPEAIAQAARNHGAKSVAFTYNDPVIFAEYAIDTAQACRELGIEPVAVTAGYIHPEPRVEFFEPMAAANVDLKAFTEEFYRSLTLSHLEPVLETLRYLVHETSVWTEVTTLVIPGANDSERELKELSAWIAAELGPEVPLHLSAFHPDYKLLDRPRTPRDTLVQARAWARSEGLRHVYLGNLSDPEGETTFCAGCDSALIRRDRYRLLSYGLTSKGACPHCDRPLPGRFQAGPGQFSGVRTRVLVDPRVAV